jgi:hypothetical protein
LRQGNSYKPASFFLNESRLDIICKYLYVKNHIEGTDKDIIRLYKEVILARTGGCEPPDPYIINQASKNNIEDYINSFNTLINSFKVKRFNNQYPVHWAVNGWITGSHRIACALYFETLVACTHVGKQKISEWGRPWFEQNNFLNEDIVLLENTLRDLINEQL